MGLAQIMVKILKKARNLVNDELFNAHFITAFIVLMIGLIGDATDLKTSALGLYCISAVLLQSIPFLIYFTYMLFLNIKVYIFFCKHRDEVDEIFYHKNFTKKQWVIFLNQGRFTPYQSLFILDMFIDRGVFMKQGKHYRYNEESSEY
jgi:hypothetical protein